MRGVGDGRWPGCAEDGVRRSDRLCAEGEGGGGEKAEGEKAEGEKTGVATKTRAVESVAALSLRPLPPIPK